MASLISVASSNFTTSTTWAVVDTTSLLDSEAASTNSTTAYTNSQTFTPGAITVDGVALKIFSKTSGGTFSVELYNTTGSVQVREVTVDVADISGRGWHFFKFSSSVTLAAATAYRIGIKSSTVNTVTVYRNATSSNWTRMLRTTTTAAPASTDALYVMGEMTGTGGAGTDITVTMDNTATTTWGSLTPTESISASHRGTLTLQTSASTNYYLRWKGRMALYAGGTMNYGTSGTPLPSTSTFVMECDATVTLDTGFANLGGTLTMWGNALSFDRTRLAADAAASATSLTTSDSTGWVNGDQIAYSSTTRTASEGELKTLTSSSGTTLTTAALTNAHSGTSSPYDIRCFVINLTRNIKFKGITEPLKGYFDQGLGACDVQWCEFLYLGGTTAQKKGVVMGGTGTKVFNRNALHDFTATNALFLETLSNCDNLDYTNNVCYLSSTQSVIIQATTATTGLEVSGNIFMRNGGTVSSSFNDVGFTYKNNVVTSSGGGGVAYGELATIGDHSGNIYAFNGGTGLSVSGGAIGGTILNNQSYRNTGSGAVLTTAQDVTIDGLYCFGNSTTGLDMGSSFDRCIVINADLQGGTTLTQPIGVRLNGCGNTKFIDCVMGTVNTHSNADLNTGGTPTTVYATFQNCTLASTETSGTQFLLPNSFYALMRNDTTDNNNKLITRYGTITFDTTIFNTASPSGRMTPSVADRKLVSSSFYTPVNDGASATLQVMVRKSETADGTDYTGAQPRLMIRANGALGITEDTVIATASAANGTWETLSGTTPTALDAGVFEWYIDCDGTAGWVNFDDVQSSCPDPSGMKFWLTGAPFANGVISFPNTQRVITYGG